MLVANRKKELIIPSVVSIGTTGTFIHSYIADEYNHFGEQLAVLRKLKIHLASDPAFPA